MRLRICNCSNHPCSYLINIYIISLFAFTKHTIGSCLLNGKFIATELNRDIVGTRQASFYNNTNRKYHLIMISVCLSFIQYWAALPVLCQLYNSLFRQRFFTSIVQTARLFIDKHWRIQEEFLVGCMYDTSFVICYRLGQATKHKQSLCSARYLEWCSLILIKGKNHFSLLNMFMLENDFYDRSWTNLFWLSSTTDSVNNGNEVKERVS